MSDILSNLAYLHGKPEISGKLKAQPEDFKVIETLSFSPSGQGEHLYLRVRKTGENTRFVANELAKACGVSAKHMGWAGLKDRHAVTEQWLSVHLPSGDTPDFSDFLKQYPHIEILELTRHDKKLRPGELIGNHFSIRLTQVEDTESVASRLRAIQQCGVANYFGSQRFGIEGNNLEQARRWGREAVRSRNVKQRSLYLSAARAWIFNSIVSKRIEQNQMHQVLPGDIILRGEQACVITQSEIERANQELVRGEIAVTAAMAGDNALPTKDEALSIEQSMCNSEPDLMALIRNHRMQHDRRAILIHPQDLSWQIQEREIHLAFFLRAGSFATALVRELIQVQDEVRHYAE